MKKTVTLCLLAIGLGLCGFGLARAAADGSGSAVVESGSGSQALPSDSIDDPLAAPGAAWDDVKAAKKIGWGVAALVIIIIGTRLLARAGGVFSFLARGKVSIVIGAASVLALTAYNALLLEGSWVAALFAAVAATLAYVDMAIKPKSEEPKA